jgi:RNA-directed DNA polymerase
MSAATRARAPSGMTWDGINWANVQRHVRGLQTRIVKATQEGRHNKVKALQWQGEFALLRIIGETNRLT